MKTIRLLFLLTSITMFSSCEKFYAESTNTDGYDENANVTIKVSNFIQSKFEKNETLTRSEDDSLSEEPALEDNCTRLSFAIFNIEEKVKNINQSIGDDNFGTININLPNGTYRVVVIAHSGKGNCTISSPEKIKFYKNKMTDTFLYYGTLEVNEDEENKQEINLSRAVAMIRIHINDDIPANIKQLKFYYTGGSSTLDATSALGCVNSRQTENLNITAGQKDYEVYTFPREDSKTVKLAITALDEVGTEVASKVIEDIPVNKNHITTYSGNLFGDSGNGGSSSYDPKETTSGITFKFDPEWEGEEKYNF